MKYRIAIIGCGALGSIVGRAVTHELNEDFSLTGVMSGRPDNAIRLANELRCKAYQSLQEIIKERPDFVVEAASPEVFKNIAVELLSNGISVIPLSAGALADRVFYKQVNETAQANRCRVHVPSGAVGGFDVLRASMLIGDARVSITTKKSPQSLNGAPILQGRELSEREEEEVFTGTASEAIKHFPKNVNVAVATALATTGVDDTRVSVISVPGQKSNQHEIRLTGETVFVRVIIETTPSADNPRSSALAAYSVVALLQNLAAPVSF